MENADLVKMMFQCFLSVYSDEIPILLYMDDGINPDVSATLKRVEI